MAAQYYNISMYITDLRYGVMDLPFLPEELEIKFDGNDVTDYLANGQFFTQKKLPKPKEIEISCFFPSSRTTTQVNKGLNFTNFMEPYEWREYFFKCIDNSRVINICFPWWDFDMDCTVTYFNPRISYAEVDDVYYTVKFTEYNSPIISPLTTIRAQGHNSWITAGEWQLVGGSSQQTVDLTPYVDPNAQSTLANSSSEAASKATEPTSSQSLTDMLIARDEQTRANINAKNGVTPNKDGANNKSSKIYICKDSDVVVYGNFRYLVNFSRNKEDINNPKYDILKDPKYGSDPFYTKGFKGDNSYKDIYSYIDNGGTFKIMQKISYTSVMPPYETTIYKICTVIDYNTVSFVPPNVNSVYYASIDVIDVTPIVSEYVSQAIKR